MGKAENKKVRIEVPLQLIQSIRLVHALDESDYSVVISSTEREKLRYLRAYFAVSISYDKAVCPVLNDLSFSHKEPMTRIGSICRPLIFPVAIFRKCREMWSPERRGGYLFVGQLTSERCQTIREWSRRWFPSQEFPADIIERRHAWKKWIPKPFRKILNNRIRVSQFGPVLIWSSERGRHFPTKVWDHAYFETMCNSQFVLCPNGDFVWTYRFFEAAMCGAIPVIQDYCTAYEGFRYRLMTDNPSDMKWSPEDAEHNFALCMERLTVSKDHLNSEIGRLLSNKEVLCVPKG